MLVEVGSDRALRIDGVDSGLVTATKVTGGAASIVTVKPEGTSDTEATFDGWKVRHVALGVLIHPRPGVEASDVYTSLATVAATAREERDDVPEQHVLKGPLTSAMGIARVICLSLDPVEETSDNDGIRLSLLFEEVDPAVALRAASATAAAGGAAPSDPKDPAEDPTEPSQSDRDLYTEWGGRVMVRSRAVTIDGIDRWHELELASSPAARVADLLTTTPPQLGDELAVTVEGQVVLQGPVRGVNRVRQVWRVRCEPEGSRRRRGLSEEIVGPFAWPRPLALSKIAGEIWGGDAELVGLGDVMVTRFSLPATTHDWAAASILQYLELVGIPCRVQIQADGTWRIGRAADLVRRSAWQARPIRRDDHSYWFQPAPIGEGDEVLLEGGGGAIVAESVTTRVREGEYETLVRAV